MNKPNLLSLKDSSSIEQDASVVILMHKEDEQLEIILAKVRD